MSARSLRIVAASLAVVVVATVWALNRLTPGAAAMHPELPDPAPNGFENARRDVVHVGNERCGQCHRKEFAGFVETAHGRALALVDAANEPPDGSFDDPKSLKRYRIHRRDGAFHHEESIRAASGESIVLADAPMKYVIGSGRFSRSYLFEREGFLFESPATWYAARAAWELSPGYERASPGFQRPVELRCVGCHAGRVEPVDNSPQRLRFHALSIGCERCHGPGGLHADLREGLAGRPVDGIDLTIAHLGRMDRDRREDVCAQCHLHSAATVELRGRRLDDFHPGDRLADFVAHYAFDRTNSEMQVVGHVEQMRLSKCWQSDRTFTCTTCHDPHARPSDSEGWYRRKCLECHSQRGCRLPADDTARVAASDLCVSCHMPKGPTEIPHFAFTHHRVGIHRNTSSEHDAPTETNDAETGEMVLLTSGPPLSDYDQRRNLGLACLQAADAATNPDAVPELRRKATAYLFPLADNPPDDPDLHAALARLWWNVDADRTLRHARAVLDSSSQFPEAQATACFTLGATLYSQNRLAEARPWLERTTALRPNADVWMMLSDCLDFAGEVDAAGAAARRASELAPDRPRYMQRFSELQIRGGKPGVAPERIQRIFEYRRKIDRSIPR